MSSLQSFFFFGGRGRSGSGMERVVERSCLFCPVAHLRPDLIYVRTSFLFRFSPVPNRRRHVIFSATGTRNRVQWTQQRVQSRHTEIRTGARMFHRLHTPDPQTPRPPHPDSSVSQQKGNSSKYNLPVILKSTHFAQVINIRNTIPKMKQLFLKLFRLSRDL